MDAAEFKQLTKLSKTKTSHIQRDLGKPLSSVGYSKVRKVTVQRLSQSFIAEFHRYRDLFSPNVNTDTVTSLCRLVAYDIDGCEGATDYCVCMKRWFGSYVTTATALLMVIAYYRHDKQVCAMFDELTSSACVQWGDALSYALTKYYADKTEQDLQN